ncbi:MAG: hypothetical protein ACI9DC_000925 [Gammaproteobacteria bacterium]|jgi:hypothetical protein
MSGFVTQARINFSFCLEAKTLHKVSFTYSPAPRGWRSA